MHISKREPRMSIDTDKEEILLQIAENSRQSKSFEHDYRPSMRTLQHRVTRDRTPPRLKAFRQATHHQIHQVPRALTFRTFFVFCGLIMVASRVSLIDLPPHGEHPHTHSVRVTYERILSPMSPFTTFLSPFNTETQNSATTQNGSGNEDEVPEVVDPDEEEEEEEENLPQPNLKEETGDEGISRESSAISGGSTLGFEESKKSFFGDSSSLASSTKSQSHFTNNMSLEELKAQVNRLKAQVSDVRQVEASLNPSLLPSSSSSSSSSTHPALTSSSLLLLQSSQGFSSSSSSSSSALDSSNGALSLLRGSSSSSPVSFAASTPAASTTTSSISDAMQKARQEEEEEEEEEDEDEEPEAKEPPKPKWVDNLKVPIDFAISLRRWKPEPGVTLAAIKSGAVPASTIQHFVFPDPHDVNNASAERVIDLESDFLEQLEAEDTRLRFKSCALVGNSGTLLGKGFGPQIDGHTAVMRLNYSPTEGYEKDVGSRTTLDLVNKENTMFLTSGDHKWRPSILLLFEGHSKIIRKQVYRKLFKTFSRPREHRVVMLNPVMVTLSRATYNQVKEDLQQEIRAALTGEDTDPARVAMAKKMYDAKLASDQSGDTSKDQFTFHPKPMSGIVAVYTALQICDKVDMYGFDPYSESSTTPYHYFDQRAGMTNVHSFDLAMEFYQRISKYAPLTVHT